MTQNTLEITFKQRENHREAARERLRRSQAGETGGTTEQDIGFVLNVEEFGDIERLVRTSNIELLRTIVSQRPESIRDTARAADRDYREVDRNLRELESLVLSRSRTAVRGGVLHTEDEFSISSLAGGASGGDIRV